jgi:RNA polymerase sigma factor (sigma-70 family)
MAEEGLLPDGSPSFPATTWSMIEKVQQADPTRTATGLSGQAQGALNRLIARYWKPIFYYLRARGRSFHEAQDLTQEFFTQLIDRDWLRLAEPARGRFRSFLLTILNRFLVDQSAGRIRKQLLFERDLLLIGQLLTDEDRAFEPASSETPETVYMRQWAANLLAAVMADLKQLCQAEGRLDWYEVFAAIRLEDEPGTQQQLAERFGLTRDGLRHRLEVLEKRLARLLRAEVREQVDDETAVDEELAELRSWLGR